MMTESEWNKLWKNKPRQFIFLRGGGSIILSEGDQWLEDVQAVGDRLQKENNKLKLFENLLREIHNADMGINIEIETDLWKCDRCGVESDESTFRYFVPMDWGCLQEYKQDNQKLEAIIQTLKVPNVTDSWAIIQIGNILDYDFSTQKVLSSHLEVKDDK